jgi:hypothetical protein
VGRQRRKTTTGTMMDTAMELKKKRNLEPMKGNKFDALKFDNLHALACDVNVKIGIDFDETRQIIDNLVIAEENKFENFVAENLEVLLQ